MLSILKVWISDNGLFCAALWKKDSHYVYQCPLKQNHKLIQRNVQHSYYIVFERD